MPDLCLFSLCCCLVYVDGAGGAVSVCVGVCFAADALTKPQLAAFIEAFLTALSVFSASAMAEPALKEWLHTASQSFAETVFREVDSYVC